MLMLIVLLKKCPEISRKKLGIAILKTILAAVFMKCVLSMGMKIGRLPSHAGIVQILLTLAIIAVVSLSVYIVFLYLEGVEEIRNTFAMIKRKGHRVR